MHTSCSYSLRAQSLQRPHLESRPPHWLAWGWWGWHKPSWVSQGDTLPCLHRDLRHAWLPGSGDPAVLHGWRAPRLREGGRYVSETPAFLPHPLGCSQNMRGWRHSKSCADGHPFECSEGIKWCTKRQPRGLRGVVLVTRGLWVRAGGEAAWGQAHVPILSYYGGEKATLSVHKNQLRLGFKTRDFLNTPHSKTWTWGSPWESSQLRKACQSPAGILPLSLVSGLQWSEL